MNFKNGDLRIVGENSWDLLACDLKANTGKIGFFWAIKCFFLEPAFFTVVLFRFSQYLVSRKFTGLSKLIWRINVFFSGCYLSPSSKVGPGFALPHPTGVVVGEGAILGSNVVLYQSVTLGRDIKTGKYPKIGSNVICYPGSIVLGGINIGDGAWIGAGCVVSVDMGIDSTASSPAAIIRN